MENEQDFTLEREMNFRVFNYLRAVLQGMFTEFNVLSQTRHPDFNLDKLNLCKSRIRKFNQLIKELKENHFVFDFNDSDLLDAEEMEIIGILKELKQDLKTSADKIKQILEDGFENSYNDAVYLISQFCRNAYSKDNYFKGFIEFGEEYEIADYISNFTEQTKSLENEIKLGNQFLKDLPEDKALSKVYCDHLAFFMRIIPGALKSQVHDLNQLQAIKKDDFTFEDAEVSPVSTKNWEDAGFNSIEAGYWEAFELKPAEALKWLGKGMFDPKQAAEWSSCGFSAETATIWANYAFSPLLAIQWNNVGFNPEVSAILVNQGIDSPDELPEDPNEVEKLVKTGYQQLGIDIEKEEKEEES